MQSCPKPGNELYTHEPEYTDYTCIEDLELSLLVLVKIPTGLLSAAVLIASLLPHTGVLHAQATAHRFTCGVGPSSELGSLAVQGQCTVRVAVTSTRVLSSADTCPRLETADTQHSITDSSEDTVTVCIQ
eukprot:162429-Rhodomonas_salina.1